MCAGPSQMMTTRLRAAAVALLGALAGGCHEPFVAPLAKPSAACGDPCAAMVCPSGDRCTWNERCQPRCEAQPMPNFGH
jgi:hypothetical protein